VIRTLFSNFCMAPCGIRVGSTKELVEPVSTRNFSGSGELDKVIIIYGRDRPCLFFVYVTDLSVEASC